MGGILEEGIRHKQAPNWHISLFASGLIVLGIMEFKTRRGFQKPSLTLRVGVLWCEDCFDTNPTLKREPCQLFFHSLMRRIT